MPKIKLKVKPDGQLFDFTTEYPDHELRILAAWPLDKEMVSIIDLDRRLFDVVKPYFDEASEISSYEAVHADEQTIVLRFVTHEPAPHRAGRASGLLPQFPLTVRNGWIVSETTATSEQIAALKKELEDAGITYEVVSLIHSTDSIDLLTARQHQFVREAVNRGYYDSPRRCSLTELATDLGVSKPTASGILHRAEGRIIKRFLEEPVT